MASTTSIKKNISLLLLGLLISSAMHAQSFYVRYHLTDADTGHVEEPAFLKHNFDDKTKMQEYIIGLKDLLASKGYAAASVDSVFYDSLKTEVFLYIGDRFFRKLNTDSLQSDVRRLAVPPANTSRKQQITGEDIDALQKRILDYYQNSGYPFAKIHTTNTVSGDTIYTSLDVDRGVLYHIDSIRIIGRAKLKNTFLQRYLSIYNGDVYNQQRLSKINELVDNLPYVEQAQPWELMMLGTGATLDLFLQPKKSSEVNALIGFLPSNTITGKTKITADVRLNLKNALNDGETILINWQQLEAQTPRLDLGFNQPYLFNSPYGIDFSFGMLKQDSSYLKINAKIGVQYMWSANRYFRVFYQMDDSRLLGGLLDTVRIKNTHQLPPVLDVHAGAAGLSFHFDNLNYLFNPRRGFSLDITGTAGLRRVTQNPEITGLKDPADPGFDFESLYDTIQPKTYLISAVLNGAHYSDLGGNSVLKVGWQMGFMASPQIFQNELFRIGGYHLLRGFDEESIYADRYSVVTGEFRLLTGVNSFLFGFVDYGLTHSKLNQPVASNNFVSTGLGLELETKFGLLNVSYAVGKRNDVKFDLRNASKIHFGYINYF